MQTKKYNIILYSGLGERKGKLSAEISGDVCNGTIYIMENENHFTNRGVSEYFNKENRSYQEVWKPEYGIQNIKDMENLIRTV